MKDLSYLVRHISSSLVAFLADLLILWCFTPADWKSVYSAQRDRGLLRNPRRNGIHLVLRSGGSELLWHGQADGGYPTVCAHGAGGANPSSPLEAFSCYFTHAEDRSETQSGSESWRLQSAWFTANNRDIQPGIRGWANLVMFYIHTKGNFVPDHFCVSFW